MASLISLALSSKLTDIIELATRIRRALHERAYPIYISQLEADLEELAERTRDLADGKF